MPRYNLHTLQTLVRAAQRLDRQGRHSEADVLTEHLFRWAVNTEPLWHNGKDFFTQSEWDRVRGKSADDAPFIITGVMCDDCDSSESPVMVTHEGNYCQPCRPDLFQ